MVMTGSKLYMRNAACFLNFGDKAGESIETLDVTAVTSLMTSCDHFSSEDQIVARAVRKVRNEGDGHATPTETSLDIDFDDHFQTLEDAATKLKMMATYSLPSFEH